LSVQGFNGADQAECFTSDLLVKVSLKLKQLEMFERCKLLGVD
jgi:hypothetical protein